MLIVLENMISKFAYLLIVPLPAKTMVAVSYLKSTLNASISVLLIRMELFGNVAFRIVIPCLSPSRILTENKNKKTELKTFLET